MHCGKAARPTSSRVARMRRRSNGRDGWTSRTPGRGRVPQRWTWKPGKNRKRAQLKHLWLQLESNCQPAAVGEQGGAVGPPPGELLHFYSPAGRPVPTRLSPADSQPPRQSQRCCYGDGRANKPRADGGRTPPRSPKANRKSPTARRRWRDRAEASFPPAALMLTQTLAFYESL